MDDQPHIRLVDAHAEGVGGGDHAQLAVDEATLHLLLGFRRQPGMKEVRRHLLGLQELRHLFALPSRRAVHDGAPGPIGRQVGHQDLVDVRELLPAARRHHRELEVGALGAAVEDPEPDAELVPEVRLEVRHHVGLGGGGQAQHRRD